MPAPAFLGAGLWDTQSVLPVQLMGCTGVQSAIIGPRKPRNLVFFSVRIMLQPLCYPNLLG